jgi:hypothetical protein
MRWKVTNKQKSRCKHVCFYDILLILHDMSTYYDILCIPANASEQEIRKAYRTQVMLYHPDKNPSPEAIARFLLITQAYEVLIDKNQRFLYDHNLGEFAAGQYYMPSYEEWMEQRRKKQAEEEENERQAFAEKKKQFQESPYYTYRKFLIYVKCCVGYLLALLLFFAALYVISTTHLIAFFVLLPFISAATLLAYLSYTWFEEQKKLW